MIVFLILIGVVILGCGVFVLAKVFDKKYDKYKDLIYDCDNEIAELYKLVGPIGDGPEPDGSWAAEKKIDELKKQRAVYNEKKQKYYKLINVVCFDSIVGFGTTLISLIAGTGLIICSIICIIFNAPRVVEKKMTTLNMERESLVYRLESQQEIGNEYLYNDIVEFNKKIYEHKYNHNNPWISVFTPEEYGTIEMIEYKK